MLLLSALVVGLGTAWGQSDYSKEYTGNVELSTSGGTSATSCKVKISDTEYAGIKCGTGSVAGAMKISVPSGTKYLHMHVSAWNGETVALAVTPNGYSENITLTANGGISGNSPFTFSGDPSTSDYYKVITFTNALAATTDVTFTASSGKRFVVWGVTAETEGGSSLADNDLALTGAPITLPFDLYDNKVAQVINYTTSSTGEVTVSESDYVDCVVDQTNKTITVSPKAVTPSDQTITVSQAADENYKSGFKTFTVSVSDNTPFDGAIFDATKDTGTSPIVKDNVSFACDNGVLNNGSEYRLYKNSTTTISTTDGSNITKIEFTGVSGYAASNFTSQTGWTTSDYDGVWEGNAESVSFVASGAQVRATKIKVTVDKNNNPSISASDVNIAFDATSGSITYTINNPAGGTLSATTTSGWLTIGTVGENVPFTCAANTSTTARKATVTLTYTYNTSETATKDVIVTQAGRPTVISDITEDGTAYTVTGTVVATNAKGFVIGDGTGYVYTYLGSAPTVAVNDKVSISGTTGTYGHILQFTNSATITKVATSNYNGTPAVTVVDATAIAAYNSDYQLSDYVQFEGALAKNGSNYEITVGTATARVSYPTTTQSSALDNLLNKTVRVKGYFAGFSSSTFTVMQESVEEVASTDPVITVSPASVEAPATETEGTINVTYKNITTVAAEVKFYEADGTTETTYSWISAEINKDNNVYYWMDANNGAERKAYMKVYALDNDANDVYSPLITITQAEYVAPAALATVTLDFTNDGWGFPDDAVTAEANYTNGGYTITLGESNSGHKKRMASSVLKGILFGKQGATLSLPAFDFNVSKIKVYGVSDASGKVTFNVFVGSDAVSTEVTGATEDHEFAIAANNQTSGTVYTLKLTNANNCQISKIEVYGYVSIPAAGYATLAANAAIDFAGSGLTAYKVSAVSAGSATLAEVTKVPFGTPVVLKGDAGNYDLNGTTEASAISGNLLLASDGTVKGNNSTIYALGNKSHGVGFYKVANDVPVPAGKAYLVVSGISVKEFLPFDFGDGADGINSLTPTLSEGEGAIYNLAGQRLQKMQKGINIVNGKKILK